LRGLPIGVGRVLPFSLMNEDEAPIDLEISSKELRKRTKGMFIQG